MKQLHLFLAAVALFASPLVRAQDIVEITPPPAATASGPSIDGNDATQPSASTQNKREILRTLPADQRDAIDLQPGEIAFLNPETNQWEVTQQYVPTKHTLADLYLEGGYEWTTAITLCLIALLFAAWKAPRWVKEFGLLALIIGFLSMMVGFYSVAEFIQATGEEVSFTLLCGGLRVAFICPIYGMIVYALSLILRIVLKPRI